jgi:hypothetical protein
MIKNGQKEVLSSIYGDRGFGLSINMINGGLECSVDMKRQPMARISHYIELLLRFGADIKEVQVVYTNFTDSKGDEHVLPTNESGEVSDTLVYKKIDMINLMAHNASIDTMATEWDYSLTTSPLLVINPDTRRDRLGIFADFDASTNKLRSGVSKVYVIYSDGTKERVDCTGVADFATGNIVP